MIYYDRERLSVLELEGPAETVPLTVLESIVVETHIDTVCVVLDGRLYGVVSLGDMLRAMMSGASESRISRTFTSCATDEVMRAREILHDKPSVFLLPAVNEDGELTGAYSRSDDVLLLEWWDGWQANRHAPAYVAAHPRIGLVRPCEVDERKMRVFRSWQSDLERLGAQVVELGLDDVAGAKSSLDLVLFMDEDERRAGRAVLEAIRREDFDADKMYSYLGVVRSMTGVACENVIRALRDSGVSILMLSQVRTNTPYDKRMIAALRKRNEGRSLWERTHVTAEDGKGFYGDDVAPEYVRAVGQHSFMIEYTNSAMRLRDCEGPYFNVRNGRRVTTGQPEQADHTVWLFGPCVAVGPYVEDRDTMASKLQALLNDAGASMRVENCGRWEDAYCELVNIATTHVRPGDVAIIHLEDMGFPGIPTLNLRDALERFDAPPSWVVDMPVHANGRANGCYAQAIFDWMSDEGLLGSEADEAPADDVPADVGLMREDVVRELYLDRYFAAYEPPAPGERVGCVCMHANPLTLGHDYLIHEAYAQSDRLILFVIEEELGAFTFSERYAMACASVKGLPNVTVASSGPFQATRDVFPQYFNSVTAKEMDVVASELVVFGESIARPLGITCRFLGEEGSPKMMRFNEMMQEILPQYGCEARILPRREVDDHAVSATLVRSYAHEGRLEELARNVPPSTLAYVLCEA